MHVGGSISTQADRIDNEKMCIKILDFIIAQVLADGLALCFVSSSLHTV